MEKTKKANQPQDNTQISPDKLKVPQQPASDKSFITPKPSEGGANGNSWAARCFRALDSDSRGHILKHELLDNIKEGGVYSHHQLQTLINALECKSPKDPIDFAEFEYLLHG